MACVEPTVIHVTPSKNRFSPQKVAGFSEKPVQVQPTLTPTDSSSSLSTNATAEPRAIETSDAGSQLVLHARLRGTALPRREGGYLASAERSTAADAALEVCPPDRPLFGVRACVRACVRARAVMRMRVVHTDCVHDAFVDTRCAVSASTPATQFNEMLYTANGTTRFSSGRLNARSFSHRSPLTIAACETRSCGTAGTTR